MYESTSIANFFDSYAEKEWERLMLTPRDQVSFYIHKHYLEKFIMPNSKILEAGAGAGRFTIELAKLGALITVGDLSKVQLDLNRTYVSKAGYEANVEARVQLDICDLQDFRTNHFDAVVCYGGPISYVLEKAEQAIGELLRVIRPGGYLLFSVMSLLGTTRSSFELITRLKNYPDVVNEVNQKGQVDTGLAHAPMKMYRYSEIKTLLSGLPCQLVAASAANYLSPGRDDFLQTHLQTEAIKQAFLTWELDYCAEEGAIDGGTHMIIVVQKEMT